jgi:hypothetical protein
MQVRVLPPSFNLNGVNNRKMQVELKKVDGKRYVLYSFETETQKDNKLTKRK